MMAVTLPNPHYSSAFSGGAGGSGSGVLKVVFVDAAVVSTMVCVEAAAGSTVVFVEAATGSTVVCVKAATGSTVVFVEAATGSTRKNPKLQGQRCGFLCVIYRYMSQLGDYCTR